MFATPQPPSIDAQPGSGDDGDLQLRLHGIEDRLKRLDKAMGAALDLLRRLLRPIREHKASPPAGH